MNINKRARLIDQAEAAADDGAIVHVALYEDEIGFRPRIPARYVVLTRWENGHRTFRECHRYTGRNYAAGVEQFCESAAILRSHPTRA
jgi:hypothetical protein